MIRRAAFPSWSAWRQIVAHGLALMALALVLGAAANVLRSPAARLPWRGEWDDHIETRAYRAGIPLIFLPGVRERLGAPEVVILDARGAAAYAAGHLPGALNIPVAEAEQRLADHAARLTPDTTLLVYCSGIECSDALELALKLRQWGFEKILLYPGGYEEWTAYGGAVQKGRRG